MRRAEARAPQGMHGSGPRVGRAAMTEPALLVLDDVPEELDELRGHSAGTGRSTWSSARVRPLRRRMDLPGWLRMADRWRSCVLRRR